MTHAELEVWREFHLVNPIDDHHRIYRPAALSASAFVSGNDKNKAIQGYMDWLAPDPAASAWSAAELNSFKAHGIDPPMRKK